MFASFVKSICNLTLLSKLFAFIYCSAGLSSIYCSSCFSLLACSMAEYEKPWSIASSLASSSNLLSNYSIRTRSLFAEYLSIYVHQSSYTRLRFLRLSCFMTVMASL